MPSSSRLASESEIPLVILLLRRSRGGVGGELGFEINVPARYGASLWRELLAAGADFGIVPYGIETVLLLRLEKGFLHVGVDTDGSTAPATSFGCGLKS